MASYTDRNLLIQQVYNENVDTWGDPILNSQLIEMVDESLDGYSQIVSTGGTYTLSSSNGSTDESRMRVLLLQNTLASNSILRIPAVEKWYLVINENTGVFTTTIGVSGGVQVTLTADRRTIVWCDGTDCYDTEPSIDKLGPATGNLSMGGNKITDLDDGTNNGDATNLSQLLAYFSSSNPGLLGIPFWRSGFK